MSLHRFVLSMALGVALAAVALVAIAVVEVLGAWRLRRAYARAEQAMADCAHAAFFVTEEARASGPLVLHQCARCGAVRRASSKAEWTPSLRGQP